MVAENKYERMAAIAQLYYLEDRTQAEIAQRLNISRPMVSRLLAEARRTGLVEIVIHFPGLNDSRLATALAERYHLKGARVLVADKLDQPSLVRGIGMLAAQLVENYLDDRMTLAISRGAGVYATVQALRPRRQLNIRVVQLQGALGDRLTDGSDVAHFLASLYSGEIRTLNAPLILESRAACEALLREPGIRENLQLARQADLALVGIGSIAPEVSSLLRSTAISVVELNRLAEQGIVGDIAGRHFDAQGQFLDIDFNRRLVCADEATLRQIPVVIGVAGGLAKLPAIRAALRGPLVNALATDSLVAEALLAD